MTKEKEIADDPNTGKENVPEMEPEAAAEEKIQEEKKTAVPKIFLDAAENIECVVNGFYNKETGLLEFAVPGEIKEPTDRFSVVKHVFKFTRVPYDRLNTYRSQSMTYNAADRSNSINILKLRDFFWLFHLEDWNFTDENGNQIKLMRDPNGALADESLDMLYRIPASILDTAMGLFERRINIA